MIKTSCSYNRDRTQNKWFLSQQSKQKRNKICHVFNAIFLLTFFRFPNHTLKLKAPDQPQSARVKYLLTCDITYLLVQHFASVFQQNRKQLMFFQNIFWNRKHVTNKFKQGRNCFVT